jgi:hypothetical protein
MTGQVVDERVSRKKFNREVNSWRRNSADHTRRGIFLVEAEFPKAFAVFAAPHLNPPSLMFAVELDFTNYDVWPPSVRFISPFSRQPYRPGQLPPIVRIRPSGVANPLQVSVEPAVMHQTNAPDGEAFMCMPGVREYHLHPAHNGDSWLLHRGTGEGTLFQILDKLHEFGIAPIGLNWVFLPQFAVQPQLVLQPSPANRVAQ